MPSMSEDGAVTFSREEWLRFLDSMDPTAQLKYAHSALLLGYRLITGDLRGEDRAELEHEYMMVAQPIVETLRYLAALETQRISNEDR